MSLSIGNLNKRFIVTIESKSMAVVRDMLKGTLTGIGLTPLEMTGVLLTIGSLDMQTLSFTMRIFTRANPTSPVRSRPVYLLLVIR